MVHTLPATKPESTAFRWLIVAVALAIGVGEIVTAYQLYKLWSADEEQRLPYQRIISGTVCQGEVIFIVDTHRESNVIDWSNENIAATEEVHCDLRTGRVTSVASSLAVRHLVSDGQTLWRLPEDKRFWADPFVWGGRPVAMSSEFPCPLLEFANGAWRETEEFLLAPYGYPGAFTTLKQKGRYVIQGLHHLRNESNVCYHADILVGTKQEFIEFNRLFREQRGRRSSTQEESTHPLFDAGWQKTEFDQKQLVSMSWPYHLDDLAIGVWNADSHVCLIRAMGRGNQIESFQLHRSNANNGFETKEVRSPVRWASIDRYAFSMTDHYRNRLVKSIDGDVFLIHIDGADGRLHVMQYKDGQLQIVGQRGSPFFASEVRAVALFIVFAILIPALVLGLAAAAAQSYQRRRHLTFGHQTTLLAPVIRRGIARAIDSSIPVAAATASIVLHPDAIGWWFELKREWGLTSESAKSASLLSSKGAWEFTTATSRLVLDVFSPPAIRWTLLLAVLFWISQVVWQGLSGKTLGKSLLGLKVQRTTLRRCGVARSLLRELLLVIDSLLLICWVPGVLSILLTRNSQRIGDYWSDTIVTSGLVEGVDHG